MLPSAGHRDVMVEVDGPIVLNDDLKSASNRSDPLSEDRGIGHGGGEAHESHLGRRHDQHLFPDSASVGILDEVHLIEDDEAERSKGSCVGQQHVAEDLGRHHDDLGLRTDCGVACQQTDALRSVLRHQLTELLVREGLERCGVERPPA